MSKNQKTSFTLIELLIVIGVIAILSAGIIIGVRDATRAARETAALVFSTTMKKTMITDMVGEWTFDDETNPGYDSSGKGNNGTLVGPPTWTADGKVRGALEFNGTTDYVNCGSDPSLNITDTLTLEAWMKTDNVPGAFAHVVCLGEEIVGKRRSIWISNTTGYIGFSGYSANVFSTIVVTDDVWHHVTATVDTNDNVVVYCDGTSVAIDTPALISFTSVGTYIGASSVPAEFFQGTIDEVRIYDAALEASQIKARYVEGLQKLHSKGKLNGVEYYQRLTEVGF